MKTQTVTTYSFDELSDDAKETAIEKFREGNLDYEWWDHVYDDVKEIGKLMGIDIDKIYFSGFCSQGDGACFEGDYRYEKGSVKKIKDYASQDKELYRIVKELCLLQRKSFYSLSARVKQSGYYMHEYCTYIDVYDERDGDYAEVDVDDSLIELLRDFMRWIYKRLNEEYDYLQSDESIIETIECNEYDFNEDGSIY